MNNQSCVAIYEHGFSYKQCFDKAFIEHVVT